MTLTIELPEASNQQFRERQIPEREIKAVVLAALELWLAGRPAVDEGRFTESVVPFTQQLIAQNRELFELLAQR